MRKRPGMAYFHVHQRKLAHTERERGMKSLIGPYRSETSWFDRAVVIGLKNM